MDGNVSNMIIDGYQSIIIVDFTASPRCRKLGVNVSRDLIDSKILLIPEDVLESLKMMNRFPFLFLNKTAIKNIDDQF
jgi:hypothetical protein